MISKSKSAPKSKVLTGNSSPGLKRTKTNHTLESIFATTASKVFKYKKEIEVGSQEVKVNMMETRIHPQ